MTKFTRKPSENKHTTATYPEWFLESSTVWNSKFLSEISEKLKMLGRLKIKTKIKISFKSY